MTVIHHIGHLKGPDCPSQGRGHFADDLKGHRFGKLVALRHLNKNRHGQALWECRCECGRIRIVMSGNLKSGHTTSCGKSGCNALSGRPSNNKGRWKKGPNGKFVRLSQP